MKKILTIAVLLTMVIATSTAIAANSKTGLFQMWDYEDINPLNSGETTAEMSGQLCGQPTHLILRQKNPFNWDEVGDNWGRLVFTKSGIYSFHGVLRSDLRDTNPEGTEYSLIYYPDINEIILDFEYNGGHYIHTMIIDTFHEDGTFSGTGYFNDGPITWTVSGILDEFTIEYDGSSYYVDVHNDGTWEGTWDNNYQSGTWTGANTGIAVWPHPIQVLETGTTNEFDNVWFSGTFDFDSIPWSIDLNNLGAKIWLVLTEDISVDENYLVGWNPSAYLFETELI